MAGQYFFKIDLEFLPLSGGTVSGNTYFNSNLSANTYFSGVTNLEDVIFNISKDVSTNLGLFLPISGGTGGPYSFSGISTYSNIADGSNINELVNWSSLTGHTSINDKYVTSGTYDNNTALITFSGANNFPSFTVDLSTLDVNDTFSTGGTVTQFASNNSNEQTIQINGNDDFSPYNITGVTDTFVTGFTFTSNTITISQNNGQNFNVNIDTIDLSNILNNVDFNINTTGNITANSFFGNGSNLTGINNFFVTGGTLNSGTLILNRQDGSVNISGFTQGSGTTDFISKWVSNTSLGNSLLFDNGTYVGIGTVNPTEILTVNGNASIIGALKIGTLGTGTTTTNIGIDSNGVVVQGQNDNDTFITGGTVGYTNSQGILTLINNDGNSIIISGITDVQTTGATLVNNTVFFDTNESLSAYTLDLSNLDVNDTFSTGGTVTQFASNNSNEQIIQINGNDGFSPYNITGVTDTFVTGFTFTPNTLTILQNNGADLTADIDTVDLSNILNNVDFNINTTGNITANSFFGNGSNLTGINNFFVTGGIISYINSDGTLTLTRNDGNSIIISGITDVQTTGATLIGNTVFFDTNESLSAYTLDLSALQDNNTFVTGFTYNQLNNTITLSQNDNQLDKIITISSFSGISVNNLTIGRVVYVGNNSQLTDESGFEYNQSTNLLTVGNIFINNPSGTTANIGQGGLVVGSGGSFSTPGIGDLIVHGNFTVFGNTTTISTTDLNIEDSQITLNYNPTGDTSVSSIGSGILIQDGGGVVGQDVKIGIGQLFGSNISGDTSEYTSTIGFENRAFVTQLNDIVIRNSSPVNFGNPDGVRVLAEGDTLDAGFY
jgi:hypothetical protein